MLRDVRVHQILEGTNEVMRLIVSRDLLGQLTLASGDLERAGSADILFERRGAAGPRHAQPAEGAQCGDARHGARARRASSTHGRDDAAVTRVVVTAAGERAFSAGGDIRALYELGTRRAPRRDADVLRARNIALNAMIKRYPKPYVALIDGIVMGGGVGVSVHGSHRVAGDRYPFAMPEVGIGFFPDVGATWFLPRLPGELGTYCALTGERLNAADGVAAGDRDPSRVARRALPIWPTRCAARSRSTRCSPPSPSRPATAGDGAPRRDRSPVRGRPRRGHSGGARRARPAAAGRCRIRARPPRHDPREIADQPEARARAGARAARTCHSRRACRPNSA